MDKTKPMTSVFYDVIRLQAVRGGFNVPIESHFWQFLGNLNPKILSAIVWTPKRHFLASQRVFWAIVREIPCSRRVRKKKERPYISRILPGAPLPPIGTNFGLRVRFVDVINCAKFYRNRLRGLDSVRVEVWPFPLDCDVAINTAGTNVPAVIVYRKAFFIMYRKTKLQSLACL